MSMTVLWVLAAIALTVVLAWAYFTARRLDRLHIRLDRSRAALQAALDRRCAVIAVTCPDLAAEAHAVEEVRMSAGDLSTRLKAEAGLRPAVAECAERNASAELQDADTRVLLALRFYNDAVADTRALRLRPVVRTLRLGGTAALPEYAALPFSGL